MKPVSRFLSVLLVLLFVTTSWAQEGGGPHLLLSKGQVQMNQPVSRMSTDAVIFVQLNSIGTLLKDLDGLAMTGLPDAILPEDFKPLLDSPTPVLSLIGLQTLGMPLAPETLEQMFGLDFSAKAAIAFYPAPGEPKFCLYIPVKHHLGVSGLLNQMLRPMHVAHFNEQGHDIAMVESGNDSLPPRLFVASMADGVLVSNDAGRMLRVLSPEPGNDAYITAQMTKLGDGCDVSAVINTQPLLPLIGMLPRIRPRLSMGLDMAISKALRDLTPEQLTQINTELRWRIGVNDLSTVMRFGKAVAMGTFDTLVEELTVGMQQSRGMMLAVNLSPTHQTLMFDVDSDVLARQNRNAPINLAQVKDALKQLDLPWSQIAVTGRKSQATKSQVLLKWINNTREQLVENQVPTKILDTCLDIYNNQHPSREIQELSDWTIQSRLIYEADSKPADYPTVAQYFASFNDLQAQPFATNMLVMPQLQAGQLDSFYQTQADEKTNDLAMVNQKFANIYAGAKPQMVRSYSVLKQGLPDQIDQYIQQTHIKTLFGLFGFNEHELISRRNLFATSIGSYTVLHDGAGNRDRLLKLKQSKQQTLDPILVEMIDSLPEGTRFFECARGLQSLPQLLAFAGQLEDLVHRDVTRYVDQVNQIAQAPGMTKEMFDQKVAEIADMPLLYQSLRVNHQDKQVYATLPLGLAMPRPKLYPVINSLLADFNEHVNDEGGAVYSSRQAGSEKQVRITQDTRLLGRLIKSLGNAIAKRYLHSGDPIAKLKEDVLSPMDGQAEFEELHHNPMWEMFLSDPQIERGFWEAVSAGPMAMIQPQPPSHRTVDVFFMDTADGSLFIEQSDQLPPIKAPSGKDGVRAFVFSCGDCGDASQQFIGWLETYTHEAKKAIETPADPKTGMDNYEVVENGHMVASPESKQWVKANSEAGFKIMDSIMNRCKDGAPKPCFPGR